MSKPLTKTSAHFFIFIHSYGMPNYRDINVTGTISVTPPEIILPRNNQHHFSRYPGGLILCPCIIFLVINVEKILSKFSPPPIALLSYVASAGAMISRRHKILPPAIIKTIQQVFHQARLAEAPVNLVFHDVNPTTP